MLSQRDFPNHYSMATGLHPDHHGLVNNFFYDAELDSSYRMGNRIRDFMVENLFGIRRNAKGFVPLPSIVGSEVPLASGQPSIWKPFDKSVSFQIVLIP